MRNHTNERPVGVRVRNADDQRWTNLLGDAEVHLPYLATFRHAASLPHRRVRETRRPPRPRNHRPINRRSWERVRQWCVEALCAQHLRDARVHREYERLPESWVVTYRINRIRQAARSAPRRG